MAALILFRSGPAVAAAFCATLLATLAVFGPRRRRNPAVPGAPAPPGTPGTSGPPPAPGTPDTTAAAPSTPAPAAASRRGVAWLLLAAAIPVSVAVTYPAIGRINREIVGNTGDAGLNIYLLEWQLHALAEDPRSYFDPTIFAPEPFTLVWGPTLIPVVPFYALSKLLGAGPITSFNLMMILATLLTLVATYVFCRRAGFAPLPGALGAVLYATTAQRIGHLGHLDSFQTLWIPVFATLLLAMWERNRLREGLLLGLALGGSLLAAPYYFLSGVALVGLMALLHLRRWRLVPWRSLAAGAVAALAIAGPVLAMSRLAGLSRSAADVIPVHWADYFHPGAYVPAMRWLGDAASALGGGEGLESWLFGSVTMTALGTAGALRWLRSRGGALPAVHPPALPKLLAALAVSGCVMSAGPYLRLGGNQFSLPMRALMLLPGFGSVRVTGRFVASALLALTVVCLVGLGTRPARLRAPARQLACGALAAATLVVTSADYPAVTLDVSGRPAEANRALAGRQAGLVVELPWPGCPGYGCLFTEPPRMIWSRFDWFPRLGGYSGYIPDYWIPAQEVLGTFPDRRSLDFLDRFGVSYVILRVSAGSEGARFSAAEAAEVAGRARSADRVQAVERFGDDYLLTLQQR